MSPADTWLAEGDTVTVTFEASEPLDVDTINVTVAGRPADKIVCDEIAMECQAVYTVSKDPAPNEGPVGVAACDYEGAFSS